MTKAKQKKAIEAVKKRHGGINTDAEALSIFGNLPEFVQAEYLKSEDVKDIKPEK